MPSSDAGAGQWSTLDNAANASSMAPKKWGGIEFGKQGQVTKTRGRSQLLLHLARCAVQPWVVDAVERRLMRREERWKRPEKGVAAIAKTSVSVGNQAYNGTTARATRPQPQHPLHHCTYGARHQAQRSPLPSRARRQRT